MAIGVKNGNDRSESPLWNCRRGSGSGRGSSLRRRDVLGRIGLALVAAVAMCLRDPRLGAALRLSQRLRAACATSSPGVPFTRTIRGHRGRPSSRPASQVRYVYAQDPKPLEQLRASLRNTVVELTAAADADRVDPKHLWREFQLPPADAGAPARATRAEEEQFQRVPRGLTPPGEPGPRSTTALAAAFAPSSNAGCWTLSKGNPGLGNQEEILVHPWARPSRCKSSRWPTC